MKERENGEVREEIGSGSRKLAVERRGERKKSGVGRKEKGEKAAEPRNLCRKRRPPHPAP